MSDVIQKICSMPVDYRTSGNKSRFQLLEESGYLELTMPLEKDQILKFLIAHPELVEQWETYSADKRTDSGWYFLNEREKWIVGYYNPSKRDKRKVFYSKYEACAAFILNEIEQMAE